jgi:hypothetical protein
LLQALVMLEAQGLLALGVVRAGAYVVVAAGLLLFR